MSEALGEPSMRSKQVTLGAVALFLTAVPPATTPNKRNEEEAADPLLPTSVLPPLADMIEHLLFPESVDTFDDMGLPTPLLRGIYSSGFETPSAVQRLSICPMLRGFDVTIASDGGTGRTGALCIGVLAHVNMKIDDDGSPVKPPYGPQGLYIVPSRELARGTAHLMQQLGSLSLPKNSIFCLTGGTQIQEDLAFLKEHSPVVVVGTPGRIQDIHNRGQISFSNLRVIVFDELSELIDCGLSSQLNYIAQAAMPPPPATLLGAPTPQLIYSLNQRDNRHDDECTNFVKRARGLKAQRFPLVTLPDPRRIHLVGKSLTLSRTKQFYIDVEEDKYKLETLQDIYETFSVSQCVVFANTRRQVDYVADFLEKNELSPCVISSDMTRTEINKVLDDFRIGKFRTLVMTDLLARTVDVQHCSLVINFSLPTVLENYLVRVGRSGRIGRGVVLNLVTSSDMPQLKAIEQFYHEEIEECPQSVADFL